MQPRRCAASGLAEPDGLPHAPAGPPPTCCAWSPTPSSAQRPRDPGPLRRERSGRPLGPSDRVPHACRGTPRATLANRSAERGGVSARRCRGPRGCRAVSSSTTGCASGPSEKESENHGGKHQHGDEYERASPEGLCDKDRCTERNQQRQENWPSSLCVRLHAFSVAPTSDLESVRVAPHLSGWTMQTAAGFTSRRTGMPTTMNDAPQRNGSASSSNQRWTKNGQRIPSDAVNGFTKRILRMGATGLEALRTVFH